MTRDYPAARPIRVPCEGSGYIAGRSELWLQPGLPACCPRCGALITLLPDRTDIPRWAVMVKVPDHEREVIEAP
jgi:hypothetical protein